jgi:hypothetical protein
LTPEISLIITLTKVNKMAMSHLYKLGAFEILLWKLLASDIVDGDKSRITKFLSQTHLLQVFLLQLSFGLIILLVPLEDCFPETFMRNPPEDLRPMLFIAVDIPATDDGSGQNEHGISGCDSSLDPYLPEGVILNLLSEVGTVLVVSVR